MITINIETIYSRDFSTLVINFLKKNGLLHISTIRTKTIDDLFQLKGATKNIIQEIDTELSQSIRPTKRELRLLKSIKESGIQFTPRQEHMLLTIEKWGKKISKKYVSMGLLTEEQFGFYQKFKNE